MKLSVSIVTFQQEEFVEQAVRSALDQVTDFDFEVVVGDDASTDGTRDILRRLKSEYPDKLQLLLHDTNFGDRGLSNVMSTIDAAKGDYIAFLDGDDYWTSMDKLQRQVDFLEAHPDCALCAHRSVHLLDDGQLLSPRPVVGDTCLPVTRLLTSNFAEKIATVVRRSAVDHVPEWYRTTDAISADWVFNVLAGCHTGVVGYLDEVMAAHRLHSDSLSVQQGADRMLRDKLQSLRLVRPYLPAGAAIRVWLGMVTVWMKRIALKVSPQAYSAVKKARTSSSA